MYYTFKSNKIYSVIKAGKNILKKWIILPRSPLHCLSHQMDAPYYNSNSNGHVATKTNMFKYTDSSHQLNCHLFWCKLTRICPPKTIGGQHFSSDNRSYIVIPAFVAVILRINKNRMFKAFKYVKRLHLNK